MSCACDGPCSCDASIPVGPRGFPGEPGPATTITASAIQLPEGSQPVVVVSGVPPTQHLQFGIPAAASPVFDTNVPVVTLPAGSPATAAIDNTNPLAPILSLEIPEGADGENGWGTAFELLDSFNMPAPGGTTGLVTIGDNRMVEVGTWVKITGFSIEGNWFVVTAKAGDDQAQFRNPGPTDLLPYWGVAASVPSNAPTGTLFSPGELGVVVGAPGLRGLQGTGGLTPQVNIVYTIPVNPPVDAAHYLVLYFNAAPPSIPTIGRFYEWNGASWDGGPNFVAAGGTATYSGAADPNVTPPSGAKLLDLYIQFASSNAVYWQLTAPTTWTTIGTVSLMGTTTSVGTHTGGGTYTFDAAVFSHIISTDSDIDLAPDTTNYNGAGTWMFSIRNSDAINPHDFTVGGNSESGIPTLPLTIPALGAANVVMRRYSINGTTFISKFVIELAYIVV